MQKMLLLVPFALAGLAGFSGYEWRQARNAREQLADIAFNLSARESDLDAVTRRTRVNSVMRGMGVCLWRDALHLNGRDDVWAREPKFRADLLEWCGREYEHLNVFPVSKKWKRW